MPTSSDLSKRERVELPAGMHVHYGTMPDGRSMRFGAHPIDQAHKPGSMGDLFHRQHGIPNTWYENHGTTQEEYDREHKDGEEGETPSEPKETDGNKDYSKVEFHGVMQWDCEKEIKEQFSKEYDKIDKVQENFDKVKYDESLDNYERFKRTFSKYFKDSDIKTYFSYKNFERVPREVANDLIQSMIDSAKECPFGASAFANVEIFENFAWNAEIMHFNRRKNDRGFGFGLNLKYLRRVDDKPDNTPTSYINEYIKHEDGQWETIKHEIKNSDGELTEWGFHFDDNATYAESIKHEYGHSLDYAIGAMMAMVMDEYSDENLTQSFNEYRVKRREDFRTNMGSKTVSTSVFYTESLREFAKEHGLTDTNSKRMYIGYDEYERNKDLIDGWFKDQGMTVIGFNPKDRETSEAKNRYGEYIYIKIDKTNTRLSEEQLKTLKEKGVAYLGRYGLDNGAVTAYTNENTVKRVKECEEMYKKLYNVDTIDPTDVYSGYGFSGFKMLLPDADVVSDKYVYERACLERLAEAYQDVVVRKDRSNSMSRLLYAHTQYEILQLTKGYDKSFEEFIDEKVGRERFAEKITKSTSNNIHVEFIDHVRKSIEKDRADTIRKHQAFISSISKQFDNKMRKKKIRAFGQTYELSGSGYFQPEEDTDTSTGVQYRMVNAGDFWKEYFGGEGQNPDSFTIIAYKDGRIWDSNNLEEPVRESIESALIQTEWGYICYNCTPTRELVNGDYIYDVRMGKARKSSY